MKTMSNVVYVAGMHAGLVRTLGFAAEPWSYLETWALHSGLLAPSILLHGSAPGSSSRNSRGYLRPTDVCLTPLELGRWSHACRLYHGAKG